MPTPWFSLAELKTLFPVYQKLQVANEQYVNNVIVPETVSFIKNYTGIDFGDNPPEDILLIARRYAVGKILADDENVRIAQARGQPSFTVAGDTVSLDLAAGKNPFLTDEDETILGRYRDLTDVSLHVDKITVASQGHKYQQARGRDWKKATDYTRDDYPRYPAGPLRP